MNGYTFDNLRKSEVGIYDLMQKTVTNSVPITKYEYTALPEHEMRIDMLSYEVYGTTNYVEEIMVLNGILNSFTIKTNDKINLFATNDLNQLQWNEPEQTTNKKSLSNKNMGTQQDPNRAPTTNPGITPVTLDTKAKKIKIMNQF